MKCITRYEMKFGDIIVPARTECIVVSEPSSKDVNNPNVKLDIIVSNRDLGIRNIENKNKVFEQKINVNNALLNGIYIHTNTEAVYMYANDLFYKVNEGLYIWQLENIFGKGNIPENLPIRKHNFNGKDVLLSEVIRYLEKELTIWIENNIKYTLNVKKDCLFDTFDIKPTLSDSEKYRIKNKCLEYKKRLETIGFTYNFIEETLIDSCL